MNEIELPLQKEVPQPHHILEVVEGVKMLFQEKALHRLDPAFQRVASHLVVLERARMPARDEGDVVAIAQHAAQVDGRLGRAGPFPVAEEV